MKTSLPPEQKKLIGNRLELLRDAHNLNQADIAKRLSITPQRWNQWESGKRLIDIQHAIKIADRFGASLDWIYRGIDGALTVDLHNKISVVIAKMQSHLTPKNPTRH